MPTTKKTTRRAAVTAAKKAPAKTSRTARPAKSAKSAKAAAPRSARPAARANGAAAAPLAEYLDAKPPKVKLVRDSFTIPRDEYAVIDALKLRAAKLGRISKKSELLRAGLKLLAACADAGLLGALDAVPAVKTGRPKSKRHGKDAAAADATA